MVWTTAQGYCVQRHSEEEKEDASWEQHDQTLPLHCGRSLTCPSTMIWKRGKDPRPQDFSLTKKTARCTKGQFRPY